MGTIDGAKQRWLAPVLRRKPHGVGALIRAVDRKAWAVI